MGHSQGQRRLRERDFLSVTQRKNRRLLAGKEGVNAPPAQGATEESGEAQRTGRGKPRGAGEAESGFGTRSGAGRVI